MRCRSSATIVILLGVLCLSKTSEATPITYSFVGVLGDCASPPLACINVWSGHSVGGQFTVDAAVPTLTAFSFGMFDPVFTWVGPVFPDPVPGDSLVPSFSLSSSPGGTSMEFKETLVAANSYDEIEWILDLTFGSPVDAFDGSTFIRGTLQRRASSPFITNPLMSGRAEVVPEPGSLSLLGTGVVLLAGRWRRRRSTDTI